MKKITYLFMGAAALLLASCSNEDVMLPGDNGDGTANIDFNVGLPILQSRAFSDGSTATKLQYQIYEVTTSGSDKSYKKIGEPGEATMVDLKKQLTLKLLTEHTYAVVFWAQSTGTTPYTVTFGEDGANLSVSTDLTCSDENLDAFFKTEEFTVTGNRVMNVEMKRPFAQINLGTSDLEEAQVLGMEEIQTYIEVGGHNYLDLITGKSDTKQSNGSHVPSFATRRFAYAPIPEGQVFPVKGHEYLGMVYVLVGEDDATATVTFKYQDKSKKEVSRMLTNVPVKRNHRTNLYGQVLTSDAIVNVFIEPNFDPSDINYSELLFAARVGGSVVLEDNVALDGTLNVQKDCIIDLGGNELSIKPNENVVTINGAGSVTFKNGSITGHEEVGNEGKGTAGIIIKGTEATHLTLENVTISANQGLWLNNANSSAVIKSGNYTTNADGQAVYVEKGKVTIEGGTFGTKGENIDFLINIEDSYRRPLNDVREVLLVKGGTFINFDPSNNTSEGPNTNFVADGYKVVVSNDDEGNTLYTVVPADVVENETDFLELYADNKVAVVRVAPYSTIDLSEATVDQLTNDVPKTIIMNEGSQIKIGAMKYFKANADLTIIGPETESIATRSDNIEVKGGILYNEATSESTSSNDGKSQTLILVYGGTLTVKNMTLINDMNFHHHGGQGINSAAIQYWNDADIVIEDSRLYSGMYVICGMSNNGNPATGDVNLLNSYCESNSSNIHGNWSYALRIYGTKANITDCEIKGIQGAVAVSYADLTINGGKYYTYNTPGKKDGFYAVYLSTDSKVTILDGEFYGPNYGPNDEAKNYVEGTSCIVVDYYNSAIPNSVIIKGGKFSGKPYSRWTQQVYNPESPLTWEVIEGDDQYHWTVR